MTFALYHVTYRNNSYYDYSINGLTGAHDNRVLPALVDLISASTSLILSNCINFTDYCGEDPLDPTLSSPPIFIADYKDADDLRANLRIDLQQLFPEGFV